MKLNIFGSSGLKKLLFNNFSFQILKEQHEKSSMEDMLNAETDQLRRVFIVFFFLNTSRKAV